MNGFTRHIETNEATAVKVKLLESINRNGFVIAVRYCLLRMKQSLFHAPSTIQENNDNVNFSVLIRTMMMLLGVNNPRVKQALDSLNNLLEELNKEISKPINFFPDLDTGG